MQECPATPPGQVAPSRFQHFGLLYYNLPPQDSTGYEQFTVVHLVGWVGFADIDFWLFHRLLGLIGK